MKYRIPIPHSRGQHSLNQYIVGAQQAIPTLIGDSGSAQNDVRDVILHALIARAAFNDNSTTEFYIRLIDGVLDIDIDQNRLDLITSITVSPRVSQFFQWLSDTAGGGGGMIALTGDVTGSGAATIATTLADDVVTDAKLRNSAALSVIGRQSDSAGDPGDITAATDGVVLRRSGATIGFGAVNLASPNAVTGVLPRVNLPNDVRAAASLFLAARYQ